MEEEEPADDAEDGRRLVRAAAPVLKLAAGNPPACCWPSVAVVVVVAVVCGSGPVKRYSPQGSNTKSESWLNTCNTTQRNAMQRNGMEWNVMPAVRSSGGGTSNPIDGDQCAQRGPASAVSRDGCRFNESTSESHQRMDENASQRRAEQQ